MRGNDNYTSLAARCLMPGAGRHVATCRRHVDISHVRGLRNKLGISDVALGGMICWFHKSQVKVLVAFQTQFLEPSLVPARSSEASYEASHRVRRLERRALIQV